MQDVEQRAPPELGMLVVLREPSGHDARAQHRPARVRHRREGLAHGRDVPEGTSGSVPPPASRRRKCDLPEPFEPSTATRSPNQTSRSKGFMSPVSSSRSHDHRALARAGAAQPHREGLRGRALLGRAGLLELAQPRERAWYREAMPSLYGRLDLERRDELLERRVLLVPAPAQLVEALEALVARRVVRLEAAAVHPRGVAGGTDLERDDAVGRSRQQLAVVRDEQHGLLGRAQLRLEPALAGHVERVVGLVEQQHLLGSAQQRLEREALLLAARERRELAPLRTLERDAERGDRAVVPDDLLVVAAGLGVLGERGGVPHLRRGVVAFDERVLGCLELERRVAHACRRHRDEQARDGLVGARHRAPRAHELVHHPEPAVDLHAALVGPQVAADDAQERRLARAVRADERRRAPLGDAEGEVGQQRPPVGEREGDAVDVDEAHGCDSVRFAASAAAR